jgi:hypothetical protein
MLQHHPLSKARFASPLIQEIVSATYRAARRESILFLLEARLGAPPRSVVARLEQVNSEEQFKRLLTQTAACTSLEMFENCLRQALDAPPVSKRGKRRSRKPSA